MYEADRLWRMEKKYVRPGSPCHKIFNHYCNHLPPHPIFILNRVHEISNYVISICTK